MQTLQELRAEVSKRLEERQPEIVVGVMKTMVECHRKYGPSSGCGCVACCCTRKYVRWKIARAHRTYIVNDWYASKAIVHEMRLEARAARAELDFWVTSDVSVAQLDRVQVS